MSLLLSQEASHLWAGGDLEQTESILVVHTGQRLQVKVSVSQLSVDIRVSCKFSCECRDFSGHSFEVFESLQVPFQGSPDLIFFFLWPQSLSGN